LRIGKNLKDIEQLICGYVYWDRRASQPIPDIEAIGGRGKQFPHDSLLLSRSKEGMLVLDVACGYGRYAIPLAQKSRRVVCLDASLNMLHRLKWHIHRQDIHNIEVIRASMTDLPFKDKTFQLLYCIASIYYVPKKYWSQINREFQRVASHLIIQYRNLLNFHNIIRKIAFHAKLLHKNLIDEHLTIPNKPTLKTQFIWEKEAIK